MVHTVHEPAWERSGNPTGRAEQTGWRSPFSQTKPVEFPRTKNLPFVSELEIPVAGRSYRP